MKLLHVLGARPQFIKYRPIQDAVRRLAERAPVTNEVVHSGQHYDYRMSQIFFDELGLAEPDYHLEVGSGSHARQTALLLERAEAVVAESRPNWVVVYGDTNTTLGAALAAAKLHVPVAHVEAGLRSRNKRMPEEINRILVDQISSILFCPSRSAVENLRNEGLGGGEAADTDPDIDRPRVVMSGDVMYDALLAAGAIADERSRILDELRLDDTPYALLTLHRAETTDGPDALDRIITFVNDVTAGQPVIFPVHPRMASICAGSLSRFGSHVRIIEPLGYFDLLRLLKSASRVLTDSGGLQKEAYWLQVPCITLRDETEWIETVESGWNVLYRNYPGRAPAARNDAYGDGHAADLIVGALWRAHRVLTTAGIPS